MSINDFRQRIIVWIKEKCILIPFFLFLTVLFLFFLEKSTAVSYWYHLDPWFNKPIGELLESGVNWEDNVMYPGLWLRLFYILIASLKVITGMSYFEITKFWFIALSLLQIWLLGLMIRAFFKKKIISGIILIVLLLCLANPFVFRRFSITVRESLAIIGYLWFLLIFIRFKFTKTFILGIFSGLIYGSNPITSFFLFFSNIWYAMMLVITRNYSEIKSWAKQFWLWLLIGLYFFWMFIGSLIWQYKNVEAEVVAKNPFAYSFYYVDLKQLTLIYVVFVLVATIIFYMKYTRSSFINFFKKKEHISTYMLVIMTMLIVLFIASYSPKVWLYQDRLVMYIVIFTSLLVTYFVNQTIRYRIILLLLASLSLVQITKNASHIYYSPFDNTNFTLLEYQDIGSYSGKILAFNFDENILFNINHILRVDTVLASQFKNISTLPDLDFFNRNTRYLLFISKDTMKEMQEIFPIKELVISGKLRKLEDGNYLYMNSF